MMKILYGVQGTGNGHIARARHMAKSFAGRQDVKVDFLFSGRKPGEYFDMDVFGDYSTRRGMTFATIKGSVSKLQTARKLNLVKLIRDVRSLDLSGYDLVLNDFEPVSAWAAKFQKVPSISISHQAAFLHPVPKHGESRLDRVLTRYFAPTRFQLGVHWYHFGHNILPPFIEPQDLDVEKDAHLVVYLPFEDPKDIWDLLEPLSEFDFECFHPDIKADCQQGHVHWRKPSKPRFQHSLQSCRGVVANGGFELSSECLQLGKKILIKPLHGQYEQLSNALTLDQLGLCKTMYQLDTDTLEQWLKLPDNKPIIFPADPSLLVDWLVSKNWDNPNALVAHLWKQVRFPDTIRNKLQALPTQLT